MCPIILSQYLPINLKMHYIIHLHYKFYSWIFRANNERGRVVGKKCWPNTCVIDSNFHVQTSLAANKPQNLLTALQFLMGPSSQNCVIYIKHFPSFRPKIAWFSFFFSHLISTSFQQENLWHRFTTWCSRTNVYSLDFIFNVDSRFF